MLLLCCPCTSTLRMRLLGPHCTIRTFRLITSLPTFTHRDQTFGTAKLELHSHYQPQQRPWIITVSRRAICGRSRQACDLPQCQKGRLCAHWIRFEESVRHRLRAEHIRGMGNKEPGFRDGRHLLRRVASSVFSGSRRPHAKRISSRQKSGRLSGFKSGTYRLPKLFECRAFG